MTPTSAPQDAATSELVDRLRSDVLPPAVADADVHVYVGGQTAVFIDLSERVAARLPLFIGCIVGLSFILLMIVFRSILVPLKAAIMNLLSIGAAYGVIVAVFQWGWGASLFGVHESLPIVSFIPMFMFAILFGLSMDYEVFLLSRIRESYNHNHDNTESVVVGITSTARVITSAALIMISVFISFVFGGDATIKMIGLGLATAVFVDATDHPHGPRAGDDAPARRRQLVVPEVARSHHPQPRHRRRDQAAAGRVRAVACSDRREGPDPCLSRNSLTRSCLRTSTRAAGGRSPSCA